MKKLIFFLVLLFPLFVSSETTFDPLTKGYADTLYCRQGGTCNLTSLTTINQTTYEINATEMNINRIDFNATDVSIVPATNTFIALIGNSDPIGTNANRNLVLYNLLARNLLELSGQAKLIFGYTDTDKYIRYNSVSDKIELITDGVAFHFENGTAEFSDITMGGVKLNDSFYPLTSNPNNYLNGTNNTVANGFTGVNSFNARGVIFGGTTATGDLQSIVNPSTAGLYYRSGGTGINPAWSGVVLPNSCSINTMTYCSGSNILAQTVGLTYNAVSAPAIFTITSNNVAFGLYDNGVGHDDYTLENIDGTFTITNVVDSVDALTIAPTGKILLNAGADGIINITDRSNLVFSTGTGTKICTATNQKMAVYGYTPVTQRQLSKTALDDGLVTYGWFETHTSMDINRTTHFTNDVNISGNLHVDGNFSAKRGYWNGYYNLTQGIGTSPQVMNLSNNGDIDRYQIAIEGGQNVTFETSGDFECLLTPEFYQASGSNKNIYFWRQQTNSTGQMADVRWSNSHYTMTNGEYTAPLIPFQVEIVNPLIDKIRFMWWSDSTASQIISEAPSTTPLMPGVPGTILNCAKISEATP